MTISEVIFKHLNLYLSQGARAIDRSMFLINLFNEIAQIGEDPIDHRQEIIDKLTIKFAIQEAEEIYMFCLIRDVSLALELASEPIKSVVKVETAVDPDEEFPEDVQMIKSEDMEAIRNRVVKYDMEFLELIGCKLDE